MLSPVEQTPERWRRVKDALDEALEAPARDRPTVLERHLGEDEILLQEARTYLGLDDEIGDFIEEPAVSLSPSLGRDPMLGRRIGPYKLQRLLGRGGMGSVYLAIREDDYEKRVAVKLIHLALSTPEIVDRFREERQILARLEHPNIARLLDGGTTGEGLPYFVMEYVEGESLHHYCDSNRLTTAQRLELMRRVCSAVDYAHRNLVVHRDLKPGNILVDERGVPKLLDFGIAKLLGAESLTRRFDREMGPMTYQYASPEQVLGEPITTSSDVYSLGVLLYEILTGHLPLRREQYRHPMGVMQAIGSQEPPKPSTAIWREEEPQGKATQPLTAESVSRTRDGDPVKLKRRLSGDVDAIVLKALRPEPEHRYSSVEQLSEDIRRHLEGRPVEARADSFGYRAGKFVRRNRLALATAGIFLVMVVAFVVALALQLEQTKIERNRKEMTMVLLVEFLENPELREEAPTVDGVIGRGVDLFGADFAKDIEAQASTLHHVGLVYSYRGEYDRAENLAERAVELRRRAWGRDHPLVAESLLNLANLLWLKGEHEAAAPIARQALEIQRRHYHGAHLILAKGITNYASQLLALRRLDEAEPLFREALRMKIELYGDVHLEVATAHANLGTLSFDRGDFETARQHYQRALEIRQELLHPNHEKLGRSYSHMARVHMALDEHEQAATILRRVLEIRRGIHGLRHPEVASALNNLAFVLERSGSYAESESLYRQALDIRIEAFGDDHTSVATVRRNLASVLTARREFAAAESFARQALASFEKIEGHWRVADVRSVLGAALAGQGRFHEAERLLLDALALLQAQKGEKAPYTRQARRRLADLYTAWGRGEEASEYLDDP